MKLAVTCVALMIAASSPAFASQATTPAGPATFEDVVGDANLLNNQHANAPDAGSGVATPGSQPGVDIVKVEFSNTFAPAANGAKGRACKGFQIVMTLSGPAADDAFFDVAATSTRNNRLGVVIRYDAGTKKTSVRYGGDKKYGSRDLTPAVVAGNTITWTLSSEEIKRIGENRGSVLTVRDAATSLNREGVYLAFFDEAAAENKTFAICK